MKNFGPALIRAFFFATTMSIFAVSAAAPQQKALSIVLTQPYTDTGLQVSPGETVTVIASGNMDWFTGGCTYGATCVSTPDGQQCTYTGFVAQGLPCWSLIGKIGNGAPFEVGSSATFTAASAGEFFLGVNDNNYPDNTGNWNATVTINAGACPAINISPILKQDLNTSGTPEPWASDIYDSVNPPTTIAHLGCYLTDTAMLINFYAAAQNSKFQTDPHVLNAYLESVSRGYSTDGSGDVNGWEVARYARSNGINMYYQGTYQLPQGVVNDATVNTYLCSGNPPLMEVNRTASSQHWVIPTATTALNSQITYSIVDPSNYANDDTLEGFSNQYQGLSLYSSTPSPPSALSIVAHSPLAPLLTDSNNGLQTGLTSSGARLYQIASSNYSERSLADDVDNSRPPTPLLKVIEVHSPTSGTYNLLLAGTGSGNYQVDVITYDTSGTGSTKSFQGQTIAGVTSNLAINYSSQPGSTTKVTAYCPGDVNGDGVVNNADLVVIRNAFGTRAGAAGYNASADVNHDGVVNVIDLSFVSQTIGCTTQTQQ